MGSLFKRINISRWIITDNPDNLDKYRFPIGTVLKAKKYLIVWADEDGKQIGFHANFKLSAAGEPLILLDSIAKQVDKVQMPVLGDDIAFARQPNGIGSFVIKAHTFNKNNDGTTPNQDEVKPDGLLIFPNPTSSVITIESKTGSPQWVSIYNSFGQLMIRKLIKKETLNTYDWPQWCLPSKNQVSKH